MADTDFGFERVSEKEKAKRVAQVFDRVSGRYDLMNDLMSFGLHRLWKAFAVSIARVRPGERVLDVASGSGDLARAFARAGAEGMDERHQRARCSRAVATACWTRVT